MGKTGLKKKPSYYRLDADPETVAYPPERLEKKQRDLERLLLIILLDYLIGALNRAETLRRGLSLIDQHFDELVEEINAYYKNRGLMGQLAPESKELKGRKSRIEAEFLRLIDTEDPYWKSEEGLKQGALLLAILAIFSANAAVAESVARAEGATLIWRTMGDIHVCLRCLELEDTTYDLGDVVPPMPLHENCRCFWSLRFEVK